MVVNSKTYPRKNIPRYEDTRSEIYHPIAKNIIYTTPWFIHNKNWMNNEIELTYVTLEAARVNTGSRLICTLCIVDK